jgi:hypothetical protein
LKPQSLFNYYFFGTSVRYLQDVSPGSTVRSGRLKGMFVLDNLGSFFASLDRLGLQVTERASWELAELYAELKKSKKKDLYLTEDQAHRLKRIMKDVRNTLEAELQGFEVYVVTPKRIDVNKLLTSVSSLLAPGVYEKLPEIARYDLTEAGKCVAYERPTAAAFHLMRCVEATLRAFYVKHLGQAQDFSLWGPNIQGLRSHFSKDQDRMIMLNNLDNIRLSFRNPTQHPEKIYDIQEIQDLWGLCVDVLNRMAKDFD